jgi:hypothetical protein
MHHCSDDFLNVLKIGFFDRTERIVLQATNSELHVYVIDFSITDVTDTESTLQGFTAATGNGTQQ